jgi:type IV pilus assembly protein PilO
LPSDKEIPELLEQVSKLGTERGLEFLTFKPQGEALREYYAEVPVSLEVTGKFHDVLLFFDDISQLPRIVTIGDMKIQSVVDTGGGKSVPSSSKSGRPEAKPSGGVQMTCIATTYRFLEGAVGKDVKGTGADKTADKDKAAKKEAGAK